MTTKMSYLLYSLTGDVATVSLASYRPVNRQSTSFGRNFFQFDTCARKDPRRTNRMELSINT